MKRAKKPKGAYRQTTLNERLLAALRVESGVPIETVAVDFGVSIAGVETWIEAWREPSTFNEDDTVLSQHEIVAGYQSELVSVDMLHRRHRVTRGPRWSQTRLAAGVASLAKHCFTAALADARSTTPGEATLLAIGRVYRCLDDTTQALYAPVWDLCQLALDELEAGRAKLARAVDLAASLAEAPAEARAA